MVGVSSFISLRALASCDVVIPASAELIAWSSRLACLNCIVNGTIFPMLASGMLYFSPVMMSSSKKYSGDRDVSLHIAHLTVPSSVIVVASSRTLHRSRSASSSLAASTSTQLAIGSSIVISASSVSSIEQ